MFDNPWTCGAACSSRFCCAYCGCATLARCRFLKCAGCLTFWSTAGVGTFGMSCSGCVQMRLSGRDFGCGCGGLHSAHIVQWVACAFCHLCWKCVAWQCHERHADLDLCVRWPECSRPFLTLRYLGGVYFFWDISCL